MPKRHSPTVSVARSFCQPWQKTDAASADGLPPLGAQSQLRTYVGILNGQAPQFGGGQLPPP
jgi:hypothetical protein